MTDVQGSAALDVAQVVAGLRQLKTGIDSLTNGMTRLNTESDKTKRTLKDTFKDSAQAAGKAGGPVGSWSSKLLGGASMGDAFGRVAVGLSLVTVGMRAYQSVVDAAIDRTRLFINAQNDMRNTADQTDKALENMARKGESQARSRTDLIAVGGKNAADDADMVTSTGAASFESASKGVAAIYGRFGDTARAKNAVDLAMRGAMGGLDFAEVSQELTRHGGAIDDSSQADRLLGRMAKRQTGARGKDEEVWQGRMANINADAFLMEARAQASARSGIPGLERNAFMGAGLGQKDAAFASDPKTFFENEAFKKIAQAIEDLKKLAETQTGLSRVLADVFQPGGSHQTQLDRLINATAKAQGTYVEPPTPTYNPVKAMSAQADALR
jgi:hypothetical protein